MASFVPLPPALAHFTDEKTKIQNCQALEVTTDTSMSDFWTSGWHIVGA